MDVSVDECMWRGVLTDVCRMMCLEGCVFLDMCVDRCVGVWVCGCVVNGCVHVRLWMGMCVCVKYMC